MQDYRTVNCYNKGRGGGRCRIIVLRTVIIKAGVEEDAGLSYCELL